MKWKNKTEMLKWLEDNKDTHNFYDMPKDLRDKLEKLYTLMSGRNLMHRFSTMQLEHLSAIVDRKKGDPK